MHCLELLSNVLAKRIHEECFWAVKLIWQHLTLKKVWADHNLSQQERAQSSLEVKQNCEDNRFKW